MKELGLHGSATLTCGEAWAAVKLPESGFDESYSRLRRGAPPRAGHPDQRLQARGCTLDLGWCVTLQAAGVPLGTERRALPLLPRSHPSDTRVTLRRLRVPSVAFAEVGDETYGCLSAGNNAYTAAGPETPTTPGVRKDKEGLSRRVPQDNQPHRHPDRGLLPPEL